MSNNRVFIERKNKYNSILDGLKKYYKKNDIKFEKKDFGKLECVLRVLKETKELREQNPRIKEYSRYWLPLDNELKLRLKDFASSFGVLGWGEVFEQRYTMAQEQLSFISLQLSLEKQQVSVSVDLDIKNKFDYYGNMLGISNSKLFEYLISKINKEDLKRDYFEDLEKRMENY